MPLLRDVYIFFSLSNIDSFYRKSGVKKRSVEVTSSAVSTVREALEAYHLYKASTLSLKQSEESFNKHFVWKELTRRTHNELTSAFLRIRVRSRSHWCRGEAVSAKYSECVCLYSCLSYPRCKSHILYAELHCHLWPVWYYHIFTHYLTKGTSVEGKKHLNIKCVFWFSLQLLIEIFLVLRTQRDIIINVRRSFCKVLVILVRF